MNELNQAMNQVNRERRDIEKIQKLNKKIQNWSNNSYTEFFDLCLLDTSKPTNLTIFTDWLKKHIEAAEKILRLEKYISDKNTNTLKDLIKNWKDTLKDLKETAEMSPLDTKIKNFIKNSVVGTYISDSKIIISLLKDHIETAESYLKMDGVSEKNQKNLTNKINEWKDELQKEYERLDSNKD